MNFGARGEDFAERAWQNDMIGIWYGSWTPDEFYAACGSTRPLSARDTAERLNRLMASRGEHCVISEAGVQTALRFDDKLDAGTWVFTFFGKSIHIAQVADINPFVADASFVKNEEVFKVKRIQNKKSFLLKELPDVYLIAAAGQGNVYKATGCAGLLRILKDCKDASEVVQAFRRLDWDEWLDVLGPKGWESLCLGYLIQEHGFLPDGLVVGGTLEDFDIVGTLSNGKAVYAQCKNDRQVHRISLNERSAFSDLPSDSVDCFFFAYKGADDEIPSVKMIDGNFIKSWLDTSPKGQAFKRRLRS